MKKISLLLTLVWSSLCYGQEMLHFKTVDFQPIKPTNYTDVQGSPYLMGNDIYKTGIATISSTQVYKDDIKLLYNQLTDEVTFQYGKELPLAFSKRPVSFVIYNYTIDGLKSELKFSSGFPSAQDSKGLAYYQILVEGDIKLLKRNIKTISESKGYGQSTIKRTFNDDTTYFLFGKDNKLKKINSYKDFLSLNDTMKTFIDENKLKKNSVENFIALTNYYNSLR
ncbi:MAG: hypothetical protein EOO43_12005 [Flavobacterium sp.]|nr:MAG: hypothetical protein EOO43_12005 [Flavobacterium sp.]